MGKFDISKFAKTVVPTAEFPRDIEIITKEILDLKQDAGNAILALGDRLNEAKAQLSHGEWLSWLTERVEFSESTAQRFMRLAREWRNPSALTDLGATKALTLLALPPEERESFMSENHLVGGEEKSVIDMTSRELEKAIRERDEARKAAEAARAEAKIAAEARDVIAKDLTLANELMNRINIDKKAAEDAVTALEQQLADLEKAPVEVAVMEVDQAKLDAARAKGEAAKAEEIADLQAKLDRAKEAKKKADEKRKNAEAAVNILKLQLEEAAKADKKAAAMADPDIAKFQVYFDQTQETVNKMRGLLLRARGREDQTNAEKMSKAILALGDAVKGAAQ